MMVRMHVKLRMPSVVSVPGVYSNRTEDGGLSRSEAAEDPEAADPHTKASPREEPGGTASDVGWRPAGATGTAHVTAAGWRTEGRT